MTTALICIFIAGYLLIAFENRILINKAAVALLMAVISWSLYYWDFGATPENISAFTKALGETSEILFFLLGAMVIVEVVDTNGGFDFFRAKLVSKSKVGLLWKLTFVTFFLSAVLDNMTTAIIMAVLFIYHRKTLPCPENDICRETNGIKEIFNNFGDIIKTYFQKPGIGATILFLLLFRFPEAQLGKIGKLFLMDSIEAGGLALSLGDIGFVNGVIGIVGLIAGGIAGGICISRKGLKYWLWPMVIAISLPDIVYVYMSSVLPQDITTISCCIFIEQLGYGFGFTAYTLYMIYFAQGKYPTAHFAISTAFMSLGMMLPGMISGKIQEYLGYEKFFVWIMACTIITFAVSSLIKIDKNFGKK